MSLSENHVDNHPSELSSVRLTAFPTAGSKEVGAFLGLLINAAWSKAQVTTELGSTEGKEPG